MTRLVALYDGECGLCSRIVQFILPRDRKDVFRFAALQSAWGQAALTRHQRQVDDFDTFVLIVDPNSPAERALDRSTAALLVLRNLGGLWAVMGVLGLIFPMFLRDWVYDLIAKNRFRFFGRGEAHCLVPSKADRAKFILE